MKALLYLYQFLVFKRFFGVCWNAFTQYFVTRWIAVLLKITPLVHKRSGSCECAYVSNRLDTIFVNPLYHFVPLNWSCPMKAPISSRHNKTSCKWREREIAQTHTTYLQRRVCYITEARLKSTAVHVWK